MAITRTYYGFDSLPHIVSPVVTIGSFDGVHRGHADLLGYVTARAHKVGGESVVVTFSPHPREVLPRGGDDFRLLTTTERKAELLGELGVGCCGVYSPICGPYIRGIC